MPDRSDNKTPSLAEEQAPSNTGTESNGISETLDPNIDYDVYPDYKLSDIPVPENEPDNETPLGDGTDIYRPEGELGEGRPWLRPISLDEEEPDYSEEIAAWERQKAETGESIYIPPGKRRVEKGGLQDIDANRK